MTGLRSREHGLLLRAELLGPWVTQCARHVFFLTLVGEVQYLHGVPLRMCDGIPRYLWCLHDVLEFPLLTMRQGETFIFDLQCTCACGHMLCRSLRVALVLCLLLLAPQHPRWPEWHQNLQTRNRRNHVFLLWTHAHSVSLWILRREHSFFLSSGCVIVSFDMLEHGVALLPSNSGRARYRMLNCAFLGGLV